MRMPAARAAMAASRVRAHEQPTPQANGTDTTHTSALHSYAGSSGRSGGNAGRSTCTQPALQGKCLTNTRLARPTLHVAHGAMRFPRRHVNHCWRCVLRPGLLSCKPNEACRLAEAAADHAAHSRCSAITNIYQPSTTFQLTTTSTCHNARHVVSKWCYTQAHIQKSILTYLTPF
jgi:hypothetical protein